MTEQVQLTAPDTPPGDQIRSPAAKNSNPKAPARLNAKKRAAAAAAAAGGAAGGIVKPRVTRRELKKLTEMDLEEKDDVPSHHHVPVVAAATAPARPFGEDATSTSITPSSLHDDFVNLMKAQGLEKMATEAGLMKDGALVDIKQEVVEERTPAGHGKRPLSASMDGGSSPTFGSP